MRNRKIVIYHASGAHTLEIPSDKFEDVHQRINECIKGKKKSFISKNADGSTTIFPSEMLKNSVITIDLFQDSAENNTKI
ncbi:hypothetical protein N0B16_03380 [Chryseobacterium sp. GMJ5]|uniref:Uncharacterized protein n=1 Tax=Chryseobacterium gilvum TaxID=2976534 RepID=A0ABT2VTZ6_9FLAO|nr:hypothetical protein [Chryseobacterium gilvum]MCU7613468.1 hypothetical protein [Chryseobacterium gilvum]